MYKSTSIPNYIIMKLGIPTTKEEMYTSNRINQ